MNVFLIRTVLSYPKTFQNEVIITEKDNALHKREKVHIYS